MPKTLVTGATGFIGSHLARALSSRGDELRLLIRTDNPAEHLADLPYERVNGEITDRRHPLSGEVAAGRILAVPFTRGSSTTTAVLLEAVRARTAPAAILTTGVDTFFALASIVATEMYARPIPIVALASEDFSRLRTGDRLEIDEDGAIHLRM